MSDNKKIDRKIERMLKKARREDKMAKFMRKFGNKPMQYKRIEVPDWDDKTRQLSAFRKAYEDFFRASHYLENSELQSHATQMLWHRLYLQKKRMDKLGIIMDMESERVQRSNIPEESVKEDVIFDGRYVVREVNEAIYAQRVFLHKGEEVGTFYDHESVNYSILSAKMQGDHEVICPNCGNPSTRENLIDGCDYCGTKFTIEDLEDKIGSFNFLFEMAVKGASQQLRDTHLEFAEYSTRLVSQHDPNFSFRSFSENLYNKIAAIHYAGSFSQISAFSNDDLSHMLGQFDEIVNTDLWGIRIDDYKVEDGMQKALCKADMVLYGFVDGKIQLRNEVGVVHLEKSADCLTQNACGPSVTRCKGCGSSISLLDGKFCPYCGRELDLRDSDWVITNYEIKLSDYGITWKEY